jgi:hypothetical protein
VSIKQHESMRHIVDVGAGQVRTSWSLVSPLSFDNELSYLFILQFLIFLPFAHIHRLPLSNMPNPHPLIPSAHLDLFPFCVGDREERADVEWLCRVIVWWDGEYGIFVRSCIRPSPTYDLIKFLTNLVRYPPTASPPLFISHHHQ